MQPDEYLRYLEARISHLTRTVEMLQWRLEMALRTPGGVPGGTDGEPETVSPGVEIPVTAEGETGTGSEAGVPGRRGRGARSAEEEDADAYRAYV